MKKRCLVVFVLLFSTTSLPALDRVELGRTPPMGWNSWNYHGKRRINEQVVIETIDAMVDRVPSVWIKNHRVDGLDPGDPITVSYTENLGDAMLIRISHSPLAATVYLTPSPELFHAASAARLLQGSRGFPGLTLIADFDIFQYAFTRLTAPSPGSVKTYAVSLRSL